MKERIQALARQFQPQVVALRRHIHSHPELAYQESNTAALVAEQLTKLGMEVSTGIAHTGVVGLLKGCNPDKKCIALRADMDALPITEQSDKPYRSQNNGVMHACGHDVHTSNLLGVAMILAELREHIEGTIKFIFQPSEEKMPSGANAMIEAGVLESPRVEAIYGLHVDPEIEVGLVGYRSGKFMASADEIYLTVIGKGGHAAQPRNFVSPLIIAADIILSLQSYTNLDTPTVLSFGKIIANGATNVIPERAELAGTLRCFDEDIRAQIHLDIARICDEIASKHGGRVELNLVKGYPVLKNDENLTRQTKALAQAYLTDAQVLDLPIRMGAEDFAYYSQQVPACFYRIGVGNKAKGITSPIHTPTFDIDETALETSTGLMSWIAINSL
jgi:amidohydrolase